MAFTRLKEITSFIENFSYLWPDFVVNYLLNYKTTHFIQHINLKTHKNINEIVLLLLSSIRYLNKSTLDDLANSDQLLEYTEKHQCRILHLCAINKVQANYIERALPVLEIIDRKITQSNVFVLELGASIGLIGYTMMNYRALAKQFQKYFLPSAKVPKINNHKAIDYLGIEKKIPSLNWVLACISLSDYTARLRLLLRDHDITRNNLTEGDAFHFERLLNTHLIDSNVPIVLLTSFFLYQLDARSRRLLERKIKLFVVNNNAYWINQRVSDISGNNNQYFIEFNGQRIITLYNDKCTNWEWLP